MDIRSRVLVFISIVIIAMLFALSLFSTTITLGRYESAEYNQAERELVQLEKAFGHEMGALDIICRDWAAWDDTYLFVVDQNPEYAASNLVPETFGNLHVDFMAYVNRDGEIVYAGSYDPGRGIVTALPPSLYKHLRHGDPLISFLDSGESRRGILNLDEGPAMVASRPILTSSREGPINGALLMGRFIGEDELEMLKEITGHEITLQLVGGQDDAPDIAIAPVDGGLMRGSILLRDVYGTPALRLESTMPRELYRNGLESIYQLILSNLAIGLIFGILSIFLLDRYVLRRLVLLDESIRRISPDGPDEGVHLPGNDEFSHLASTVNELLMRLRAARRRLEESEQRYRAVIENQTELIARTLPDGTHRYANAAYCRFFGKREEEIVGHRFRPEIPAEDRRALQEHLSALRPETPMRTIEHRVIAADGSVRWVSWTNLGIYDESGRLLEIQSVGRDVTARRHAEEALRGSNRLMTDIIEFLPDATFVVDGEGRVIAWNRAMERLTGVPKADMIGKGNREYSIAIYGDRRKVLLDLLNGADSEAGERYVNLQRDGDRIYAETKYPVPLTGEERYIWITASLLYDAGGRRIGAIESIRDITERKLAELSLNRVNSKLNLLASLTRHDILNAITALQYYQFLVREKARDGEEEKILGKMEVLLSQIRELVEFTRDYQEIGVRATGWLEVSDLIESAAAQAKPGEIRIENRVKGLRVYADPLLEKVFFTLIENAIRHGERVTRISFSTRQNKNGIEILCEDDGVGVPPELKQKIFAKGFGKNTGLGLFLARETLSITGLEIEESGEYGRGACFAIRVPPGRFRMESAGGAPAA